jgi:hypothetical protein
VIDGPLLCMPDPSEQKASDVNWPQKTRLCLPIRLTWCIVHSENASGQSRVGPVLQTAICVIIGMCPWATRGSGFVRSVFN